MEQPYAFTVGDSTGHAVPARRFRGQATGLSVILPGLGYRADFPLLAGIRQVLCARSEHVVTIDYDYRNSGSYLALDDSQKLERLRQDGRAYQIACRERFGDLPLKVAGKSLGTICMSGLDDLAPSARWIWLTPSLSGTDLLPRLAGMGGSHFTLIGTRDPAIADVRSSAFRSLGAMTCVEVDGMDHPWQHPGGEAVAEHRTADAMTRVSAWLDVTGP